MVLVFIETVVEFYNCNFTGITIRKDDDRRNKIIYCESSNITMMNVEVRDNDGRFMFTQQCNVQITDSDLRNNNGSELLWIGQSSNAHVINSTFIGNQALNHGTLTIESSHLTTVGCQFLGNTAKTKGAAVHVSRGSEYNNQGSLFADNTAGEGGKITNVCFFKVSLASQIFIDDYSKLITEFQKRNHKILISLFEYI